MSWGSSAWSVRSWGAPATAVGPNVVALQGKTRLTERLLAAALIGVIAVSGKVRETERLTGFATTKAALQGNIREIERLSGGLTGKVAAQGTVREVERLTGGLSVKFTKTRAVADTAAGLWLSTLPSLFAAINEPVRDDANFIYTSDVSKTKLKLDDVLIGAGSKVVTYIANGDGGTAMTARLVQGATVIAEWTQTPPVTFTSYVRTLTAPQVAAITVPSDLYLEFETI